MPYISELDPGIYLATKIVGDVLDVKLIEVLKGRFGNNVAVFGRIASANELKGRQFIPFDPVSEARLCLTAKRLTDAAATARRGG